MPPPSPTPPPPPTAVHTRTDVHACTNVHTRIPDAAGHWLQRRGGRGGSQAAVRQRALPQGRVVTCARPSFVCSRWGEAVGGEGEGRGPIRGGEPCWEAAQCSRTRLRPLAGAASSVPLPCAARSSRRRLLACLHDIALFCCSIARSRVFHRTALIRRCGIEGPFYHSFAAGAPCAGGSSVELCAVLSMKSFPFSCFLTRCTTADANIKPSTLPSCH